MVFLSKYKWPILFFLLLALSFSAGWKVHSYYTGYQQNLEKTVQESIDKGITDFQKKQAQGLEDTKKLLANAKTNTIQKERIIVEKPIYLNNCLEEEGVGILEEYKRESSKLINPKGAK